MLGCLHRPAILDNRDASWRFVRIPISFLASVNFDFTLVLHGHVLGIPTSATVLGPLSIAIAVSLGVLIGESHGTFLFGNCLVVKV